MPAESLRVIRWNGYSKDWGVGTKHELGVGSISLPIEVDEPKQQIESILFLKPSESEGKWGVDHFWQQGALNAQGGTLRIPLDGSPISDYYVSP